MCNRQSEVPLRVRPLLRRLESALALLPRPLPSPLEGNDFILVDRLTMARVHGEFLGDASPTDVITFPYGEILICPAVAREQAALRQLKVEDEVLLYGLHGLLHLAGYDDRSPVAAARMEKAQKKLLGQILRKE